MDLEVKVRSFHDDGFFRLPELLSEHIQINTWIEPPSEKNMLLAGLHEISQLPYVESNMHHVLKSLWMVVLAGAGVVAMFVFALPVRAQEEVKGGAHAAGGRGLVLVRKIDSAFSPADDKQTNDGSYYHAYLFKLEQGKKYYVRMDSSRNEFEPFFWVRGLDNIESIDGRRVLFGRQAVGRELWCWFSSNRTRQVLFIANTHKAGQTGNYTLEIYTDK